MEARGKKHVSSVLAKELLEAWKKSSMDPTSEGEIWFVISKHFLISLEKYALYAEEDAMSSDEENKSINKGESLRIRNSILLPKGYFETHDDVTNLSPLDEAIVYMQGQEFEVCCEAIWKKFSEHFEYDFAIPRRIYCERNKYKVEIQPLSISLYTSCNVDHDGNPTNPMLITKIHISRADTICNLTQRVEKIFDQPRDKCVFMISDNNPGSQTPCTWRRLNIHLENERLGDTHLDNEIVILVLPSACTRKEIIRNGSVSANPMPMHLLPNASVEHCQTNSHSHPRAHVQPITSVGEHGLISHNRRPSCDLSRPNQLSPRNLLHSQCNNLPSGFAGLSSLNNEPSGTSRNSSTPFSTMQSSDALDNSRMNSMQNFISLCNTNNKTGHNCSFHDSPARSTEENCNSSVTGPLFPCSSNSHFEGNRRGGRGIDAFAIGGLCGLCNLGNTCFMNSAIQCLSKILPLSYYFLSGNFWRDINETNVMGTQGRLAKAYNKTLEEIWYVHQPSFAPRELKWAVGEVRDEFLGYNQQDSQELMAFLLDGLHEDLNRIQKKPYYESKIEGDANKSDLEVANACWKRHKEMNDSIIVDLFQGQYRSRLECPKCGRVSVTFDPFMYLSLPITPEWRHQIHFSISLDLEEPYGLKYLLPCTGNIDYHFAKQAVIDIIIETIENTLPCGANLDIECRERLTKKIMESTGISELKKLSKRNVLIFLKRSANLSTRVNGDYLIMDVFTKNDIIHHRLERKNSNFFVWFLPSPVVEELEKNRMSTDESIGEMNLDKDCMDQPNVQMQTKRDSNAIDVKNESNDDVFLEKQQKKRKSEDLFLPSMNAKLGGSCLILFVPLIMNKEGETRFPQMVMPFFHIVGPATTCEEIYNVVSTKFFTYESCSSQLRDHKKSDDDVAADDQGNTQRNTFSYLSSATNAVSGFWNLSRSDKERDRMQNMKSSPRKRWKLLVPKPFLRDNEPDCALDHDQNASVWSENKFSLPMEKNRIAMDYLKIKKGQHIGVIYIDISNIPEEERQLLQIRRMGCIKRQQNVDITGCLQLFSEQECLDEDNMWYCSTCKKHVQAFKKLDLWRMPAILILHLKRFHNVNRWSRSKISTKVNFPHKANELLDMSSFILPEGLKQMQHQQNGFVPLYELVAVNVHSGELGGGHYYAYVNVRGKWYEMNDQIVTAVNEEACHASDAYMLFYQLKSVRAIEYDWNNVSKIGSKTAALANIAVSSGPSAAFHVNNQALC